MWFAGVENEPMGAGRRSFSWKVDGVRAGDSWSVANFSLVSRESANLAASASKLSGWGWACGADECGEDEESIGPPWVRVKEPDVRTGEALLENEDPEPWLW